MATRSLPSFVLLWSSYPQDALGKVTMHPCDQTAAGGGEAWSNQCAIRMSVCLVGAGFPLTHYTEPKCKHGHARGAESLANYLWRQVGRPQIATTAAAGRTNVENKTGIVFFKNLGGAEGDHIDLWNAGLTKTGEYFDLCKQSWFWPAVS